MENIFLGAKFGDEYRTRNGKKVYYQRNFLSHYIDPADGRSHYLSLHTVMSDEHIWAVDGNGIREDERRMGEELDIVDRWEEPIDEEKLTKMANAYMLHPDRTIESYALLTEMMEAFKDGYRKAKEE